MAAQRIRVVTDVSCELSDEQRNALNITLVPGYINRGDDSTLFDGANLDRVKYYDELKNLNPLPTTAAPAPGVVQEIIDGLISDADHLILITIPRTISAYYEAFRLGTAHLPEGSVTLLESGTLSMGQDVQVQVAAEVAAETGNLAQVLDAVKRARANTRMCMALDTLENLRRSGRVNMAQAGLATLLQLKPILTMKDAETETLARVRTFRKVRLELLRLLRAEAPLERLVIGHANNPDSARWLAGEVADIAPETPRLVNVSPIIGTHLGAGMIGFASLKAGWRD